MLTRRSLPRSLLAAPVIIPAANLMRLRGVPFSIASGAPYGPDLLVDTPFCYYERRLFYVNNAEPRTVQFRDIPDDEFWSSPT